MSRFQLKTMRSVFFASILLSLLSSPSISQDKKMEFLLEPPEFSQIFGTAWTIYADGPIDSDAADRFEQLVKQRGISPYSTVYLNSPGGSLITGIELGRLFRKYGFNTNVGKFDPNSDYSSADAYCLSACTLAYIGGRFRHMREESVYGVHRFYSEQELENPGDIAQILSAYIVQYLTEFDIPTHFFMEMTKVGPDEISVLSKSTLEEMRVVNNGFQKERWSINALPGQESALYLKGERDTQFGINKFMVLCTSVKSLQLIVIFDPQGRQDEVMVMGAQSLFIDGQSIPYSQYLLEDPEIVNGWLNATYHLPIEIIDRIIMAETIGFTFQYSYEAPIFLGYQGMKLGDGRQMLKGLRASCLK